MEKQLPSFNRGDTGELLDMKERTITDARFLENGAKYVVDEQTGGFRLELTVGQVRNAKEEMERGIEQRKQEEQAIEEAIEMYAGKPLEYRLSSDQTERLKSVLETHITMPANISFSEPPRIIINLHDKTYKLLSMYFLFSLPTGETKEINVGGFSPKEFARILVGKDNPSKEKIFNWQQWNIRRTNQECEEMGWKLFDRHNMWKRTIKVGRDVFAGAEIEGYLKKSFGYDKETREE